MQTLSTTEVARSIGAVVLDVQRQPIKITKRGAPVAVVLSWEEYRTRDCTCVRDVLPADDGRCPVHHPE